MSNPYLGSLSLFPFNFAPKGFAACNGQLLPITQNQALFSLLGTSFGGNGVTNFALPNLQGRVALSSGQGPGLSNYTLGQTGGAESVTLQVTQIPTHIHTPIASSKTPPTVGSPQGNSLGAGAAGNLPYASSANTSMAPGALSDAGSSQAHENRQPYIVLNWCIALTGIYPSRN